MMRLALALLLAVPALQDPAAEARKAVQALLALAPGDEEGFDEQADRLLGLGEPGLDAVEEALKTSSGFPLIRLRDMLWHPITIRGAVCISDSDKSKALNIPIGAVLLSFNGQPVSSGQEYTARLQEAERRGLKEAVVELFHKGRRRSVVIPGLRMGGSINVYPDRLARYVHEGHRDPAWDEAVKRALAPGADENARLDGAPHAAAVDKGCKDPLVFWLALDQAIDAAAPEEALRLWEVGRPKLRLRGYGRTYYPEALYAAARANLETGREDEALARAREALDLTTDNPIFTANLTVLVGAILERRDPEEAARTVRRGWAAAQAKGQHRCWQHNYLSHLLRASEKPAEAAKDAPAFSNDDLSAPRPHFDGLDFMQRFQGRRMTIVPPARLYPDAAATRPGGLTGTYYAEPDLQGRSRTRIDPMIAFHWDREAPLPEIPQDRFSVRWTGLLEPPATGPYTFTVRADDGVRVKIDGRRVIDAWRDQPQTWVSGTLPLEAGKKVPIEVDYYDKTGGAVVELYWDSPALPADRDTGPWALVYRNNFDIPDSRVRLAFQSQAPSSIWKAVDLTTPGLLRINGERFNEMGTFWGDYAAVRLEMDVTLKGKNADAGLRACVSPAWETEVGVSLVWPREVQPYLYHRRHAGGYWTPWLDLRKPHRLALEVLRGRASTLVDGRWLEAQAFPPHWSGRAGLRVGGSVDLDTLELFVPSTRAVDNTRLRALYDAASTALLNKDLPAALGALEEAAALQPRTEELSRHYAAVLLTAPDAAATLAARLAKAASAGSARMLIDAEPHLDLLMQQEERRRRDDDDPVLLPDPGRAPDLSAARLEAAEPAERLVLADAAVRAYERGLVRDEEDVKRALNAAAEKTPASPLLLLARWRFSRTPPDRAALQAKLPLANPDEVLKDVR